jgi:hypothetical protein
MCKGLAWKNLSFGLKFRFRQIPGEGRELIVEMLVDL